MQESGYKSSSIHRACGIKPKRPLLVIEECVWQDFGMAQVNYKNVKTFKLDIDKLLFNDEYSIDSGARMLKWFYKTYKKRNPKYWWVRYNCGTRKSINRPTCNAYRMAVKRWM